MADRYGRFGVVVSMVLAVLFFPSLVMAHRGFGPAELGLPLGTTVLVAVVCYWVVRLWPVDETKDKRHDFE